jgi:hypothetical protein
VSRRYGIAIGDVLIGLSALVLLLALAYPALRARNVRVAFEEANADVETLRQSAVSSFENTGTWPLLDEARIRDRYSMEWRTLEFVEQVPAPPPLVDAVAGDDPPPDSVGPPLRDSIVTAGGIVVHSRVDDLLASLLAHYGPESSFVRDSTWTLVLRPGGEN